MNKIVAKKSVKRNIRGYLMLFGLLSLPGMLHAATPVPLSDDSTVTYDYTLQNCPDKVSPIKDKAHLDIEDMPDELSIILRRITSSDVSPSQLLAMITFDPTTKNYGKYLFSSHGFLEASSAQQKAHKLNYHLIKSPQGPVSWQVLSFLDGKPDLKVEELLIPEKSSLSLESGYMCMHLFDKKLPMSKTGSQGEPFPTTVAPASAINCFYSDRFTGQQRRLVRSKIGEKTFPAPAVASQVQPYPQDDQPMGSATSSVRNKVPIQPVAKQNQLHMAMQFDFPIKAIEALLTDPQTKINTLDSSGKTPLDYATKGSDVYHLLVGHGAKTSQQLKAPVFKDDKANYNSEDDQKGESPKPAATPLLSDQLLIPANGQCLYTTIIMGYLLPVRNDIDEAIKRIDQLFGMQPADYVNELSQILENPTHYLAYLHSDAFGKLVTNFMVRMKIKKGTWGGPQEIQTIATKLKVNIQAYYPDPSNPTNLVQSDSTKPAEENAAITIDIVRDKVHPDEVRTEVEKASAEDNPHYQHYRLKYTLLKSHDAKGKQKLFQSSLNNPPIADNYIPLSHEPSSEKDDPIDIVNNQPHPPVIYPHQDTKKDKAADPAFHTQVITMPYAYPQKEIDTRSFDQKVQQYRQELRGIIEQTPSSEESKVIENWQKFNHASYTSDQIRDIAYELAEIDQMPPCIERKVKQLICYALFLQQQKQGVKENIRLSNGKTLTMDKDIFLQHLQDFQAEENLKNETKDTKRGLDKAVLAAKVGDWVKAKNLLRSVKKKIQPLDFQETFWLVEKAEEAAGLVTGQHTILFIGNTGAGKSTILHTLAGSTMGKKTVTAEKNGKSIEFTHIAPIEIHDKRLEKITTSPVPVSETRYITAFPLTLKEHGIYSAPMSTILLCDTPGFQDNRGTELGIANSISITKAFQQCKEIKPVLLIPYSAMGDRMGPLRELANLLIQMLPDIEGEIESFFYIFTHVQTEDQQEEIKKKFEYGAEEAEESGPAYQAVLGDISEKLEEGKEAIFFSPLKGDRKKILKTLVRSSFIQNPQNKFESYTTLHTKSAIEDQVEKQCKQILTAARHQNYTLVGYKLDELLRFHQILPEIASVKQKYDNVVRVVAGLWNQQYEQAQQQFLKEIQTQPQLHPSTLQSYRNTYHIFLQAEKMRAQHLPDAKEGRAFLGVLSDALAQLRAIIEKSQLEDPQLLQQLTKIKKIPTLFPFFKPFVIHTFEALETKIKTQERALQQAIANKQFAQVYKLIVVLQHSTSLQPFLPNMTLDPSVYSKQLVTQLTKIQKEAIDIVQNIQLDDVKVSTHQGREKLLSPMEVTQLQEAYTALSQAATCFYYDFEQQELCSQIKSLQKPLLDSMVGYVAKCAQKIDLIFQEKQANSFPIIRAYRKSIEEIRVIEDVQTCTARDYHDITEKLDNYVYQIFQDIQRLLFVFENFFEKDAKIDYKRLLVCVDCLEKTKSWIGESQALFTRTIEQFSIHMKCVEAQIGDFEIDYTSLAQISRLFNHLKKLQILREIMPKITQQSKRIYETLSSNFKIKIEEIQNQFDLDKRSLESKNASAISLGQLQDAVEGQLKIAQELLEAYQKTELPGAKKAILRDETGKMLYKKCNGHLQRLKEKLRQQERKINEIETNWKKEKSNIEANIGEINSPQQQYNEKQLAAFPQRLSNWAVISANSWLGTNTQSMKKERLTSLFTLKKELTDQYQAQLTLLEDERLAQQKQYDHLKSLLLAYQQGYIVCESRRERSQKALEQLGYRRNRIENFIQDKQYLKGELVRVRAQIKENREAQYRFKPLDPKKAALALNFLEEAQRLFPPIRVNTSHSPSSPQTNLYGIEEEKQPPFIKNTANTSSYGIRTHIANALQQLYEYLAQYGKVLSEEVMCIFSELDDISDFEQEKNEVLKKKQALSSRFKEISDLAKKYPKILGLFGDDIKNTMQTRLEKLARDIEEKLMLSEERKEKMALANAIKLVRALRDFDAYLDQKEFFHGHYVKYREALYGQIDQSVKEIMEAIEEKKYDIVVRRIDSLRELAESGDQNAAKNIKTIQEELYSSLEDMFKAICSSINLRNEEDIEPDSVEKLNNVLDVTKLAKKCFFKKEKYKNPILDDDQQQQLQRLDEKIESAFSYWVKNVEKSIEKTISMNQFAAAEKKIKLFERILRFLGEHYAPSLAEGADQNDDHTAIQGTKKFEKALEDELTALVKYYKEKEFEITSLHPYMSNKPKELYDKLKQAEEFHVRYDLTWKEIEEDIKTKFQQLLDKSLKEKKIVTRENYLKLGKQIIETLPDDLKGNLKVCLEEKEKQISIENETLTEEINAAFAQKSADGLSEMWVKLCENESSKHINDFKKQFNVKILEIEESYEECLQEENMPAAYEHLCKLSAYAVSFEKEKKFRVQEVKVKTTKKFEAKYREKERIIKQNLKLNISPQQAVQIKKAFDIMNQCKKCATQADKK